MKQYSPMLHTAFIALFIIAFIGAITLQMPVSKGQYYGGQNSISGRVYDANHNAIPGAKVTIYYTKFMVNDYQPAEPVKSADNPQLTGNGSTSLTGLYQFSGLVPDVYIITAEKEGIAYSGKVQLRDGTITQDITIPGYIEKNYSASPTVTPKPSPTFTNVIPTISVPAPDLIALIMSFSKLSLMGLIGLQFIAGVAIIVLRVGKPK